MKFSFVTSFLVANCGHVVMAQKDNFILLNHVVGGIRPRRKEKYFNLFGNTSVLDDKNMR